jgi:hypothetical protein
LISVFLIITVSHKQIITNNSTFEPGAAEIHFAQDQAIPPKDEVNQLFNNMLVSKEDLKCWVFINEIYTL